MRGVFLFLPFPLIFSKVQAYFVLMLADWVAVLSLTFRISHLFIQGGVRDRSDKERAME